MTSPRQKKKKLAILKMLKKQKEANSQLDSLVVAEMNNNLLIRSEKHANDRSDQSEQKQTDLTDKSKNGLKELKNKKAVKTNVLAEDSVVAAEKVDDQ